MIALRVQAGQVESYVSSAHALLTVSYHAYRTGIETQRYTASQVKEKHTMKIVFLIFDLAVSLPQFSYTLAKKPILDLSLLRLMH